MPSNHRAPRRTPATARAVITGSDPNQPRVPSGHGDGGQWTKTGGGTPTIARREAVVDHSKQESWGSYVDGYRADGSLAEQRVFNRDRSRIISEFKPPNDPEDWDERHTVILPDGQQVHIREQRQCAADLRRRRPPGQRHGVDG